MSENSDPVVQELSDLDKSRIAILETQVVSLSKSIAVLSESNEALEKVVATMSQAYIEVVAMLEAIISTFLNKNAEERNEFLQAMTASRKKLLETLMHGMDQGRHAEDKFVPYPSVSDEGGSGD